MTYDFTNTWFQVAARRSWEQMLPRLAPRKILEIGSFEGQSTSCIIETVAALQPIELHCIDTWEGGVEHKALDMSAVETRFTHNIGLARAAAPHPVDLRVHRTTSDVALPALLAEGHGGTFDFIYVDASHQAPDVLFDALLSFKLARVGAVICFDDYLWSARPGQGKDLLNMPKPAIDAFVNLHIRKLTMLNVPLTQIFVRKDAA